MIFLLPTERILIHTIYLLFCDHYRALGLSTMYLSMASSTYLAHIEGKLGLGHLFTTQLSAI